MNFALTYALIVMGAVILPAAVVARRTSSPEEYRAHDADGCAECAAYTVPADNGDRPFIPGQDRGDVA